MTTDKVLQEIQMHPLFVRLKNVVENIDGWHDHEDVYTHSLATLQRAEIALAGEFITDKKAKELFVQWVNSSYDNLKIGDILLLTALLHDCGKILSYKENNTVTSINEVVIADQTRSFEHGYWGAIIVLPKLMENLDLSEKIKLLITELILNHEVFNTFFFLRLDLSIEQLIKQVKAHGHGLYKELLFGSYCDCMAAPAFAQSKKKIEMIFNQPNLYVSREYFLPKD